MQRISRELEGVYALRMRTHFRHNCINHVSSGRRRKIPEGHAPGAPCRKFTYNPKVSAVPSAFLHLIAQLLARFGFVILTLLQRLYPQLQRLYVRTSAILRL